MTGKGSEPGSPRAPGPLDPAACDRVRPRLPDLLAGALDAGETDACLAHVESCLGCGERLASLERLESDLFALGPTPPPSRDRRDYVPLALALAALAVATSVAVALALGALGRRSPPRAPRVVAGELAAAGRPLQDPTPPFGVLLAAPRATTLSLATGALVEASPGTTFVLAGPRELRLREGELAVRLEPETGTFTIQTPRGAAIASAAAFGIQVQLPEGAFGMSLSRTGGVTAAAAVTILVTSGVVLFRNADDRGSEVRLGPGEQARAGIGSLAITRPSTLAEVAAARSADVARLTAENAELKAELARAREHEVALEQKLAQPAGTSPSGPGSANGPAPATPETARAGKPDGRGPRLRFQEVSEIPELAKLDWRGAGEASRNLASLMKDLMAKLGAGEPVPHELSLKIADENHKLVKVALALGGKLPTNATGNGEYTHPAVLANIEAGHLEAAGLPLSDDQVEAITALGADYDASWKTLQAGYTADTLALVKLLDELALKKTFCDRMDAVLTPEQRAQLFDPNTRHVLQLDLYSPMLMVIGRCVPVGKATAPEAAKAIASGWLDAFDVDETRRTELEVAAGRLVGGVTPPSLPIQLIPYVRIDEALAAGRANVNALEDLLRTVGTTPETKTAIASASFFYVPRLVVKSAPAPAPAPGK